MQTQPPTPALSPEVQSALAVLASAGVSPAAVGQTVMDLFQQATAMASAAAHRQAEPAAPAVAQAQGTAPAEAPRVERASNRPITPMKRDARPRQRKAPALAVAPAPVIVQRSGPTRHTVVKVYRQDGQRTTVCVPLALMNETVQRSGDMAGARMKVKELARLAAPDVENLSGWVQDELTAWLAHGQGAGAENPMRSPASTELMSKQVSAASRDAATPDLFQGSAG